MRSRNLDVCVFEAISSNYSLLRIRRFADSALRSRRSIPCLRFGQAELGLRVLHHSKRHALGAGRPAMIVVHVRSLPRNARPVRVQSAVRLVMTEEFAPTPIWVRAASHLLLLFLLLLLSNMRGMTMKTVRCTLTMSQRTRRWWFRYHLIPKPMRPMSTV